MEKKKCCVAIIAYQESLEGSDYMSVQQALNIFSERDIYFVVPEGLNVSYYNSLGNKHKYMAVKKEWLESYDAYNRMCMNPEFYKLFGDYEYLLIYQTDCWVYNDRLDDFMKLNYDWYGAPWPIYNYAVGNGGLSLRKVRKMIDITSTFKYTEKIHEDGWFCLIHKDQLNICPWDKAVNFSLELVSEKLLNTITTLPMGLHGKHLIEIWDEDGNKFKEFKRKTLSIFSKKNPNFR